MAWQDREKEWDNLQAVQQKVGLICMVWAAIDYEIDQILADLLDVGPVQVGAVVTDFDFKKKCNVVRRLLVLGGPSPEWASEVDALMNELAEEMTPRRNRYVHDTWRFNVDEIRKVERRTVKKRPQSRQPLTLVVDQETPITIAEMEEFCSRALAINSRLGQLRPDLVPWLLSRRAELSDQQ